MGMTYHRHSAAVIRSKRWNGLRVEALRRDGWACVQCGASGRLEVDHIKPVRDAPALAFDLRNLQCLCPHATPAKPAWNVVINPPHPSARNGVNLSPVWRRSPSIKEKTVLDSVKIQRRQSEIRQSLAELLGKEIPSGDETRSMETLDSEYRTNEDQERTEAKGELETRSDREFADMMAGLEMRQVAPALDEGAALSGRTAEIVSELRSQGGFRGVPIPWQALEQRAGETVAGDNADPIQTRPIIDRLFPGSAAAWTCRGFVPPQVLV